MNISLLPQGKIRAWGSEYLFEDFAGRVAGITAFSFLLLSDMNALSFVAKSIVAMAMVTLFFGGVFLASALYVVLVANIVSGRAMTVERLLSLFEVLTPVARGVRKFFFSGTENAKPTKRGSLTTDIMGIALAILVAHFMASGSLSVGMMHYASQWVEPVFFTTNGMKNPADIVFKSGFLEIGGFGVMTFGVVAIAVRLILEFMGITKAQDEKAQEEVAAAA